MRKKLPHAKDNNYVLQIPVGAAGMQGVRGAFLPLLFWSAFLTQRSGRRRPISMFVMRGTSGAIVYP
jgi:hypothetical protein